MVFKAILCNKHNTDMYPTYDYGCVRMHVYMHLAFTELRLVLTLYLWIIAAQLQFKVSTHASISKETGLFKARGKMIWTFLLWLSVGSTWMAMAAAAIPVPVVCPLTEVISYGYICVGISLIHLQRFVGARL